MPAESKHTTLTQLHVLCNRRKTSSDLNAAIRRTNNSNIDDPKRLRQNIDILWRRSLCLIITFMSVRLLVTASQLLDRFRSHFVWQIYANFVHIMLVQFILGPLI